MYVLCLVISVTTQLMHCNGLSIKLAHVFSPFIAISFLLTTLDCICSLIYVSMYIWEMY